MANDDTYPTLDAYSADVLAAGLAYQSDMAVQRGICAACLWRTKDQHHRRCHTCRRHNIPEGTGA